MKKALPNETVPETLPGNTLGHAGLAGVDLLALLSRFHTIGAWRQVLASGHAYWSPGMYDIFGMPYSTAPANLLMAMDRYHEEDRQTVYSIWEASLQHQAPFCITVRIMYEAGYRLITAIGDHRRNELGEEEVYGIMWHTPGAERQTRMDRQAGES